MFARREIFIGLALSLVLGVSPVTASDPPRHFSGTVEIDQTRVAFLVSGNGGGGMLHFRGKDYPFSIGGLGIGGIGISKLEATGKVYNLDDPAAFTGMYSQMRTGITVGDKGNGRLWLKNGDGVMLELKGKSQGVALSLGADAVHISYK